MSKSPDAFRTISEVADWLGIQAHVLRFWESKFTQVRPVKRAGGRRYYRPADMLLLGGIKKLLHDDGLTIKGVQKILREEGMSHVSALSPPLDDADMEAELAKMEPVPEPDAKLIDVPEREPVSVVLPFEAPKPATEAPVVSASKGSTEEVGTQKDKPDETDTPAETAELPEQAKQTVADEPAPAAPPAVEEAASDVSASPDAEAAEAPTLEVKEPEKGAVEPVQAAPEVSPEAPVAADETAAVVAEESAPSQSVAPPDADEGETAQTTAETAPVPAEYRPDTPAAADVAPAPRPEPASPKARDIGMPDVTPEDEIHAEIATLARASRMRAIDPASAQKMAPLLVQLADLRDRMAARHTGA